MSSMRNAVTGLRACDRQVTRTQVYNDSTGGKEEQHRFASDPVTDEASQRLPEHEDE